MNTKAVLITLFCLLLAGGAYLGYEYFLKKERVDLWSLVPASALAVYQAGGCEECIDSVTRSPIGQLFSTVSTRHQKGDTVLSSLFANLTQRPRLISIHKITKSDFDLLFYCQAAPVKTPSTKQRLYEGLTINEVSINGQGLSWVDVEGFRLVSRTAVLVEDGIRTYRSKENVSFKNTSQKVRSLPTVKNDAGDVVLSLSDVSPAMALFANDNVGLRSLGSWSVLDVKRTGNALTLNGFSEVDSSDRSSLLSLFEGQSPVPFLLKNVISNDAQYVVDLGFTDAVAFGKRVQQLNTKINTTVTTQDLALLYAGLGQEVAWVSVDVGAGKSASVCLVSIKGDGQWPEVLNRIARETSTDTLFQEPYSDFLIGKIRGNLTGEVFPLFNASIDETYYVQVGDVFMLSDDVRALKKMVSDVEQENVWSKSVEKNKFLSSTLLESNVNFFGDPQKAQRLLLDWLNPQWREYVKKENMMVRVGLSAVQFSKLNDNFYTNVFITAPTSTPSTTRPSEVLVNLSAGVATKAFIVKNHNDKSWETVLQDSAKNVYLLDKQGKTLWQKQLDGFVKGDIHQIDYFVNGKLQLLLATERTLYLIDRLGNQVSGFPRALPFAVEMLNVIDYDHSRKYRYVFVDARGTLRMTDKDANVLEGWTGLPAGGPLLTAPQHDRVNGRDYISALRKDGHLLMYNRRGEGIRPFPWDGKTRLRDTYFLVQDERNEKPYFVLMSTDGARIKIDLSGREVSRETLPKPSIETFFRLVKEQSGKSYVVVRQDNKRLSILNALLEEVVVNEFIGINNASVQVYDFGSGKMYYTIVDTTQELGYVYNAEGALLTEQPIECQHISLAHDKGNIVIVSVFNNRVQMINAD